ncbi:MULTISPECIES: hypothetical protein [unclassified Methylobacterium]|uniref:hypothetical protein n=1 Tax=unclassified Methylobacterium TaxID=2615210 RepID=UPI00226A68AA|nr:MULTISPECIES: hypothetical protein [unclassified Methylobacterium]
MKALALVLLASAPALADRYPTTSEPWHYEGRAPARGGEARFARLDAVPDRRGGWTVAVTCGRVSLTTGREAVTYRGTGSGGRSRGGLLGGTMTATGYPTLGWTMSQQRDGILDQHIVFAAPGEDNNCPNGTGDINTGD